MDISIGIDLGTTFSCVAYLEAGVAKVIPNSEGIDTTPSVIWFDGKAAFVGKKANDRKITPTSPVYEFVKRDIGKPKYINTRYEINGYYYGAMGMSAIILRKLKKEAFNFFKKKGMLAPGADEKNTIISAIITVPAYFGDLERYETRNAGYAAGLDVIGIINEPTAAALTYGMNINVDKKIMVFDLGGGTFDMSIVDIKNGRENVISNRKREDIEEDGEDGQRDVKGSKGCNELGGKDWDELIIEYLYSEFNKRTGNDIPDDMGWEIQQKALEAKFDLTENEQTTVTIPNDGTDVEIILYREDANQNDADMAFDMDEDRPFYFEERSSNLLSLCRTICISVLEEAHLSWGDIDEIVLAGGSCRMPMIPKMLENLTGRKIPRNVPGFSFDTAIAIGAAIYGSGKSRIRDVTSKTIGLELKYNGSPYIEHLIQKNTVLPVQVQRIFKAEYNAVLKIYEGDSHVEDECVLRGRLTLENPEGNVKVTMNVNKDGVFSSFVEYPPDTRKDLYIKTDDEDIDKNDLRNKIGGLDIRL